VREGATSAGDAAEFAGLVVAQRTSGPVAQRLVIDPRLGGDVTDAAPGIEHQLRDSLPELGVRAPSKLEASAKGRAP
jgi:hypothetical protein